jgi:hypothetical protein
VALYELTCQECGVPHEVIRKDAKWCPSCRLLRNLEWAVAKFKRARRCRSCGELYRPFRPLNRDAATCGACIERADRRDPVHTCPLCRRGTAGVDGVPVCWHCVKSPDFQPKLLKALRKGRRERAAKYGDRVETQPRLRVLQAPRDDERK